MEKRNLSEVRIDPFRRGIKRVMDLHIALAMAEGFCLLALCCCFRGLFQKTAIELAWRHRGDDAARRSDLLAG